jgi:electron transfer flavoprotein beta subunit
MAIHSIVCIKSVVRTAPDGVGRRTPENSELNPYDRPALEAALRIKESLGGTVTALSMGPPVGVEALAEAQAMGAYRAVLVCDPALAGSDTLVTSRVLAAAVQRLSPFTFLFFGTRTSDSDTGQVGPQTATLLDIPFVSGVKQMEPREKAWELTRLMDDWQELWRVHVPAAVTIHPRFFAPRSIALGGIAQAHDHPEVQTFRLSDLGIANDRAGLTGSPTRVAKLQKVVRKRGCRMLSGEPREQVEALVEILTSKGLMGS